QRQDPDAPVAFECQRNFTVLYTDGYSGEGSLAGIGNADMGAGAPFEDSHSGTLGDIAWKYYQDLGLSGDTVGSAFPAGRVATPTECRHAEPDPAVDCNADLHMNTFAVTSGQRGQSLWGHPVEAGSTLRYLLRSDAHAHPPQWSDVNTSDSLRTAIQRDDLYHGVVNGFGELYGTNDAAAAAAGLRNAMTGTEISQFESITSVAIARDQAVAGTSLYSASFETGSWTGRLTARLLDPSARSGGDGEGGVEESVLGAVEWEAGTLLDARDLVANPRAIITSNDSGRGIPFRWSTSGDQALRSEAIADLRRGQTEDYGVARLEYLRGHDPAGYNFRERQSLLGDIVHSSPVYVGTPRQLWPDNAPFPSESGERYSDFRELNRGRDPMVYVGANDGMLHGFSAAVGAEAADGGQERLAYIPGFAFNSASSVGLSLLTEPEYNHRYYTDLTPSISDAYFQGHGDSARWHTVLLGGMRTGGRGLFALDVTDPGSLSEANAGNLLLWEFTHSDLGYLTEALNVALVPWGDGHEWVAVFGNGYRPESGRAGLFMLRMDGGVDGVWSEGSDYRFIEVDATAGDGLTADARLVDTDRDGVTDRIYATGRDGRVWAFVPDGLGSWVSAYTAAEGSTDPVPMFTARDGAGNPQPITTGVMVVRNPFVGSDEGETNLLVLFGTGSYLSASDLSDLGTQSFYGVWDSGLQAMDRDDLQQQSIVTTSGADGELRNLADNAIDWDASGISGQSGWFFDFDDPGAPGERLVQMPRVEGDTLFFNTTVPEPNPCRAGGSGFRMFVSLSGGDPSRPVFDANNDGVVDALDGVYSGFRHTEGLLSGGQLFGGLLLDNTTGVSVGRDEETRATVVDFERNQRSGRLGWQELLRSR
ncbi:MAG: PilC/PilY family type IV pilus protein, partial [Oleiphilaceae bacterium]|nr:PilC/PilY family type IV pilus protein [Oleiphilaceae bacterium]